MTSFVLKLFKERFYDEVDRFWICFNNHAGTPRDVVSEFLSKVCKEPKVRLIYHPTGIGNGVPITEMTLISNISKDDLVMLLEDDGYIFEGGEVNRCFQQIESDLVDAIGSPRFSCGNEIGDASKKKYNLDYSGYGDVGPNFWPCFFFVKRKDLLRTDLDFGSHTFHAGEYSKELDHTFKEINHGDTMVWMCIQLRALGLRFGTVPQHKADVYEITSKRDGIMNWHSSQQPFKWVHGGSLSAGYGGYLSGRLPDVSHDSAKQEIESRVAFWTIASDVVDGFTEFKKEYKQGIENLITNCFLDRDRIEIKIKIYRDLMKI